MGLPVKTTADISVDFRLIIKQISRRFCQRTHHRITPPPTPTTHKKRDQPHSFQQKTSKRSHWAHPGRQHRQVPATKTPFTPPAMPATLTLMLMTFPSSLPPTRHNDAIRSVVFFFLFFFFLLQFVPPCYIVLLLPAAAAGRVPPPSPQPPETQCLVFNFPFICCIYPASLVAAAASSGRNDWSFLLQK